MNGNEVEIIWCTFLVIGVIVLALAHKQSGDE